MNSRKTAAPRSWRWRWVGLCWSGTSLGLVVYTLLALSLTFLEPRVLANSFTPVTMLADGRTPLDAVWLLWLCWGAALIAMYRVLRVPARAAVVVRATQVTQDDCTCSACRRRRRLS